MFDKHGQGMLTWVEFASLLHALGFPNVTDRLLQSAGLPKNPGNSVGLDGKELSRLLHSDAMMEALDYTFNKHNNTYNVRVIKKVIALLIAASLDVESIRHARTAFFLHEGEISNGVPLEPEKLLAILRLTTRSVAPSKLQEWIRQSQVDIHGKVQLYEFLDLFQLADEDQSANHSAANNNPSEKNGLYEIQGSQFLLSPDRANQKMLDTEYESLLATMQQQHESSFNSDGKKERDDRGGNKTRSKAFQSRVQTHQERYLALKQAIGTLNAQVKTSAAAGGSTMGTVSQISDETRKQSVNSGTGKQMFDPEAHDDVSKLR